MIECGDLSISLSLFRQPCACGSSLVQMQPCWAPSTVTLLPALLPTSSLSPFPRSNSLIFWLQFAYSDYIRAVSALPTVAAMEGEGALAGDTLPLSKDAHAHTHIQADAEAEAETDGSTPSTSPSPSLRRRSLALQQPSQAEPAAPLLLPGGAARNGASALSGGGGSLGEGGDEGPPATAQRQPADGETNATAEDNDSDDRYALRHQPADGETNATAEDNDSDDRYALRHRSYSGYSASRFMCGLGRPPLFNVSNNVE